MDKNTLVWGASIASERYSHKAVLSLLKHGFSVEAYGLKPGKIGTVDIQTVIPTHTFHTITLYINPENQKKMYDSILALQPKRLIFNPGTENEELKQLANNQGIQTLEACTLVLLSTGQF